MKITDTRLTYKPFLYPFADEYCQNALRAFWLPEEVNMQSDIMDWQNILIPAENHLLR